METANTQKEIAKGQAIIFYDGVCGLCNSFVKFVLANTQEDSRYYFASLQSEFAKEKLAEYDIDALDLDSISVLTSYESNDCKALRKSDAVIFIMRKMKTPFPFLAAITSILPKPVRDFGYTCVAKIRYKIFGKYETCMLPNSKDAEKFIEV